MNSALCVYMGKEAARKIGKEGWSAELFSLLLGASGGPKWFILSQLDRLLFADFLQRSERPLSTLGSSIGSWRNTCLAMRDPAAAVERRALPGGPARARVDEAVAEGGAGLCAHGLGALVHAHRAHPGQVDQEGSVGQGFARDIVTCPANRDE